MFCPFSPVMAVSYTHLDVYKRQVFSMEAATGHPLQAFADLITIEEYKKKDRPKVVLTWAPHPRALPQAVPKDVYKRQGYL